MVKVSIVIPVYNVERYLRGCLDSLTNQTYSNIEVLVIDDGSTDYSGSIADEYCRRCNKFKVFHQKNKGVASARNLGILNSTGDYITFVDPDDWVTQDYVETLVNLSTIDNSDLCISTQLFTKKNEKQSDPIINKIISSMEAVSFLLSPATYVGSYGKLYKRRWLIENQIFQNESIYSGEGLHFTVKAACFSNSVTISNKKIYFYRRNVPTSATTKFDIAMFVNNEHSLNVILKEGLLRNKKNRIMWLLFRTHLFISGIISLINNSSISVYNKEYAYWKKSILANGVVLLCSNCVPMRSKLRIVMAIFFTRLLAKLSYRKRKKIFYESV